MQCMYIYNQFLQKYKYSINKTKIICMIDNIQYNKYQGGGRMKKAEDPMCKNMKEHKLKDFYFCFTCADMNINTLLITFCRKCYPSQYTRHENHKDLNNFNSQYFKKKTDSFRHYLTTNRERLTSSTNAYLKQLLSGQQIDLTQINFVKWLVEAKFWNFDDRRIEKDAQEYFQKLLHISGGQQQSKQDSKLKELIDWGAVTGQNGDDPIKKMLEEAKDQKQNLLSQQKIIQTLLEVQSCLTNNQKVSAMQKMDNTIKQFPNSTLLLFIKLYMLQMHSKNIEEWKPILDTILKLKPNLKQSPLCLYLQSHKYWVKIQNQQFSARKGVKFVDGTSGNFYLLQKPKEYLALINQALIGNQKSFILLASKGLGLIAQGKYLEATKFFKSALQTSNHSQSIKMNDLYCKLKQKQLSEDSTELIMQDLENRSKQYIINTIKLLKHLDKSKELLECCSVLQQQGNITVFSNIQLIKALLKYNNIEDATTVRNSILDSGLSQQLQKRLDRKFQYCEARILAQKKNYKAASEKCQQIVVEKPSASSLYSLASIKYNEQQYELAEQYLNQAMQIKQNSKYYKLKLYLLLMRKELEEAKNILEFLPNDSVDPKIRELLKQFGTK